jgi:hypothetical protein
MSAPRRRMTSPSPDPGAGAEQADPLAPLARPRSIPRVLWGIVPGMIVGVALLVALPVVMIVDRDDTIRAIMNDQPDLNPSHQGTAFVAVIVFAVAVHAVDAILTVWFGVQTLRGKQWARIALTVYLVVATLGSLASAAAVPTYLWAIIPGDGVHILMLVLLWLPPSVRAFFAAHRAGTPRRPSRVAA